MKTMWICTKDYITFGARTGVASISYDKIKWDNAVKNGIKVIKMKSYDDDNNLCHDFKLLDTKDSDWFAPLDDLAMPDAGATM